MGSDGGDTIGGTTQSHGGSMSGVRRKDTPAKLPDDRKFVIHQNHLGDISISVEEVEEKTDEKTIEEQEEERDSIRVVETNFDRQPRRSSFRSKERKELTRGASIQFDDAATGVIVIEGTDNDSDREESHTHTSYSEALDTEELSEADMKKLTLGVGMKVRRNSLDKIPGRTRDPLTVRDSLILPQNGVR